ncbi:MAG TPA: MFS transporter [Acidimicrobiales bacterium]|nr:MFS transporter [Acidimicrobiales bacterium]
MKQRLLAITDGAPTLPLLVLFALNLVDEFDRLAFGILTPDIRDTFGLSDTGIVAIGAGASVLVLLMAMPIAYLADRTKRVRLAAVAAVVWGTMGVVTGLAPVLVVLILGRLGSGLGRIVNEPVHASLLTDYYAAPTHPRVFSAHRFANPLSAVFAVPIGLAGATLGWRTTFVIIAIPTFVLAPLLSRLREPARGASIDEQLATEAATEAHISFGEARRQLFAVRTLRRTWTAIFFLGIASIPINQFISLFYEQVYGFDAFRRGIVTFLLGAATVVGLLVGQRFGRAAITNGTPERLAVLNGVSFVVLGVGLALMALSPWALLSLTFGFLGLIGLGFYQPMYFPLVGLVAPPRVRSQAFGYAILFLGGGGLVSVFVASLGESRGYRPAIAILSVLLVIGGFIAMSASSFVRRDIAQAAATLSTARLVREELDRAGERALLVCRGVEVAYDQVQVLFGIDLEVREGEILALLGTNGSGKSTLLKAICGLEDPIGGAIFFDGADITHADANQSAASGIVLVPGGKAVFPTLTVAEHLRAASWMFRDDRPHLERAIADVYDTFPRLLERREQLAGNLSGGEQQMLALGMAFIAKPKLLMIDELSLGLAPTIVEQLLGIVRRIRDGGTAVVLVEQSINVALTVAERAYFLEKGEVRFEGPTAELLKRDDIVRSVFLEGNAATRRRRGDAVPARLAPAQDASVVLRVDSLSKSFGGILAVDDTSFDLADGEILGLIGPNGAGKTTIFDLISGFVAPNRGRIELDGVNVTEVSAEGRAWLGLGRSFQDARLVPALTVAENLAIGLDRHLLIRDHVASMLSLPLAVRLEEDVAWAVDDLIELMNLGAFRNKFVSELSTGSRRIVDLAMTIAHDPRVLLLDEPSSGIAQAETEALGPLLRRIQSETGCALLVIEHDMPLITTMSDRLIALDLGHPIAEGTPSEVIRDPRVVSSYLGGDLATINRSGRNGERKKRKPTKAGSASR